MSNNINELLAKLGVVMADYQGQDISSVSPIDGATLAVLRANTADEVNAKIEQAHGAFLQWRNVPAPRRGELVRLFGEELRTHKETLGKIVTLEAGKILQEGWAKYRK